MVATMQRHAASPSIDSIVALIDKAKLAYEDCSDASGGYKDLRKEVRKLREALRDLKAEFKDAASEVNSDRSRFSSDLTALVTECNSTLDALLDLIDGYWKRKNVDSENLRLRQADLDQIGNMRLKLINCKMFVEAILEDIEKQERRNGGRGYRDEELLDDITRRMDRIADGLGRGGDREVTVYEDDLEETWHAFRDKLISQGVSSDDLNKYGSNLRRHLRNLAENGRLSQTTNTDTSRSRQAPLTINTSNWLSGLSTPPLSIDTINSASTDTSIKELGSREENIKFPADMKGQRALPGSRHENNDNFRVGSWNGSGNGNEGGYALAMVRVPEPEITTTDMILRDDFASERKDPTRLLGAPPVREHGRPRRSSDEVFMSTSPLRGSPINSARSSVSFNEGYRPRLSQGPNLRPDSQDGSAYGTSPRASGEKLYGSSPRASGALFGSSPTPNISGGMYGHSPRVSLSGLAGRSSFSTGSDAGMSESSSSTLQPDQAGRPIPANAQWTKVNRRLISPEVLNGGGYRYEARENYVAILGVLTRDQLQILADRTLQVRASRSRRPRAPITNEARPTSRSAQDATPSTPSAFPGVPAQKQALKPILKNANKSVRWDDEDLKGSEAESVSEETSDASWTLGSDTESNSDRRRVDVRDDRRRERERGERERDRRTAPMGHGRAVPLPITGDRGGGGVGGGGGEGYLSTGGHGGGSARRGYDNGDARSGSYDRRDRDREAGKRDGERGEGRREGGKGEAKWGQKLTAGGIGAAAGTFLSVAADVILESMI